MNELITTIILFVIGVSFAAACYFIVKHNSGHEKPAVKEKMGKKIICTMEKLDRDSTVMDGIKQFELLVKSGNEQKIIPISLANEGLEITIERKPEDNFNEYFNEKKALSVNNWYWIWLEDDHVSFPQLMLLVTKGRIILAPSKRAHNAVYKGIDKKTAMRVSHPEVMVENKTYFLSMDGNSSIELVNKEDELEHVTKKTENGRYTIFGIKDFIDDEAHERDTAIYEEYE